MSNIVYSGNGADLTFSDGLGLGSADAVLSWSTFRERPSRRAEVVHEYPGLDGVEVVDAGARTRLFTQTGLIRATSESNLAAARLTVLAKQNAETGTLSAKGENLSNVDLVSAAFGKHLVGSAGSHYQWYALLWRKGE